MQGPELLSVLKAASRQSKTDRIRALFVCIDKQGPAFTDKQTNKGERPGQRILKMTLPENLSGSQIVADAKCPVCSFETGVVLKVNKGGGLYIYCPPVHDGGCNNSSIGRSDKANGFYVARFARKWRKPEFKSLFAAAGSPPPLPEPKPQPAPDPAVVAVVPVKDPVPEVDFLG